MERVKEGLKVVTAGVKVFFERDWTMQEKVLLVIDCILVGVILGAIWSPKKDKHAVIGSYNSGNGCGNGVPEKEE